MVWLLVGLPLVYPLTARAQTQLRWKFAPGETLRHTLTQESSVSANLGGQPLDSTSTTTVETFWSVNRVDPQGQASITQTTPRVHMTVKSPAGEFEIDTAGDVELSHPAAKKIAGSLKAFADARVTLTVSPHGEISNVQIEKAKPVGGELAQLFGKEGLVSMARQSMLPVSSQPVQPGSSWRYSSELEVPMLGRVIADSTLTYDGSTQFEGRTLERIKVDTVTTIAQKPGTNPANQVTIKEQSDKGSMYFDNAAGRFSHAETIQVLTLELAFGGLTIEQKVKNVKKSVLTVVPVGDFPARSAQPRKELDPTIKVPKLKR
jgi:hypothetical protein